MRYISLSVEVLHQSNQDAAESHSGQLVPSADHTGEEDGVLWSSKDISMDLLPAILVSQISLLRHSQQVSDRERERGSLTRSSSSSSLLYLT